MTLVEKVAYATKDWQTENINYQERGKDKPMPFYELLEPFLEMEKEQLKEMYLKGIENYDPKFKEKKDMEKVLELKTTEYLQKDTVFLLIDKNQNEILKLCPNGDIFVKGRLTENDKEVVDAFKEWLNSQCLKYKNK